MSALELRPIGVFGAFLLAILVTILPSRARCEFTSPLDVGEPTTTEVDQLIEKHPSCGALIIYSSIASTQPELLLENLDTAVIVADRFAVDAETYDNMVEAFRVIALDLSEHYRQSPVRALEYWRRACDNVERCMSDAVPSPGCRNRGALFENLAD